MFYRGEKMKSKRQSKIIELIEEYDLETQEDLIEKLIENGFDVTQATISRDIKELRLVKSLTGVGKYKYVASPNEKTFYVPGKFNSIFSDSVIKIGYAENIVCIKCFTGMANAACAALDSMHWDNVVGSLAGDDTIFILMRSSNSAEILTAELNKIAKK